MGLPCSLGAPAGCQHGARGAVGTWTWFLLQPLFVVTFGCTVGGHRNSCTQQNKARQGKCQGNSYKHPSRALLSPLGQGNGASDAVTHRPSACQCGFSTECPQDSAPSAEVSPATPQGSRVRVQPLGAWAALIGPPDARSQPFWVPSAAQLIPSLWTPYLRRPFAA